MFLLPFIRDIRLVCLLIFNKTSTPVVSKILYFISLRSQKETNSKTAQMNTKKERKKNTYATYFGNELIYNIWMSKVQQQQALAGHTYKNRFLKWKKNNITIKQRTGKIWIFGNYYTTNDQAKKPKIERSKKKINKKIIYQKLMKHKCFSTYLVLCTQYNENVARY